jgi:hypothetical protein
MKLPFGKYKGKTINWIKENDTSYYNWLESNVKDLELKYGPKSKKKKEVLLKNEPVVNNTHWNNEFVWNEEWSKDIDEKLFIWFNQKWYKSVLKN